MGTIIALLFMWFFLWLWYRADARLTNVTCHFLDLVVAMTNEIGQEKTQKLLEKAGGVKLVVDK